MLERSHSAANLKNVSTKSEVLAPFNSSMSDLFKYESPPTHMIENRSKLRFCNKAREANRQYEFNYNSQVDNGIIIKKQ